MKYSIMPSQFPVHNEGLKLQGQLARQNLRLKLIALKKQRGNTSDEQIVPNSDSSPIKRQIYRY